jgi:SAM-dependent methyltransferase
VDLGRSIEIAERNTRDTGRVACVQADVRDLPLSPDAFDLVYSLGVLHHIGPTEEAVQGLADLLRPAGALLLYLYYALDSRSPAYRGLFRMSNGLRRISSRLPQPALVALSTVIAIVVYYPLARAARIVNALGQHRLARSLPLNFYADLSFQIMRNDSLDRFGTELEKRYTKSAVRTMLLDVGLTSVVVSDGPPFWHAVGRRSTA